MGVFIRGMEMPKSCGECDYCHPTIKFPYWCYLVDFPIKPSETDLRDGLCPLIEVTEPHGRLIYADDVVEHAAVNGEDGEFIRKLADYIDDADAIIEAEGERMGGKYSIIARNLDDLAWQYDWYGDSFIKFICKSVYALTRYEVVQMGKHGN